MLRAWAGFKHEKAPGGPPYLRILKIDFSLFLGLRLNVKWKQRVCESFRSVRQVALYTWHTVRFTRQGRRGRLQVDDQPVELGASKGAFTQLTLSLDLFVGGHRNFDEVARLASVDRGFHGCIQKVRSAHAVRKPTSGRHLRRGLLSKGSWF